MTPKNLILVSLALLAFVSGAISQWLEPGVAMSRASLTGAFVGVILSFMWFRLDAEEHNYQRSSALNISIVAFALFAFPYYLFRSRGWRGGSLATLAFVLSAVAWSVFSWLGAWGVYELARA